MSHFTKIKTEIRDKEALKKALADLGYTEIEDGEHLALYGYRGDQRPETADLVIRRHHIGSASNDVGFVLADNGTYQAIVSQFDLQSGFRWGTNRGRLIQRYAYHTVVSQAQQQGFTVSHEETEQDGTVRVVVQRWR